MRAEVYWIPDVPGRLAIMPRPRGGEWLADEVRSLREQGVDVVVSLLEADEVVELELEREAELCADHGMDFISLPVRDRSVPADVDGMHRLAKRIAGELLSGRGVTIHCRAGIGRSAVVAACVLVGLGIPAADAFRRIGTARRCSVPDTSEQLKWVETFEERAGH